MKTFKIGGIHPESNKIAHQSEIEIFPLPKQAVLYATQHLGAPSTIVVAKGDKVKVGQLISKGEAFISANLHSPYSGTVSKVDVVADLSRYKKMAIVMDVDGDEWESDIDLSPEIKRDISMPANKIIEKIKEKGIVGLGGACFPTHVKFLIPQGKKAEYMLINAAECEPYISIDNRVMLERTEEFIIGACILRNALQLDTVHIGLEHNKPEAIQQLKEIAKNYKGVEIHPLQTKYPQGAEKQLIKAITGREVPSGKLPIDVGCIVNNVCTALAVYEAVQKNKPLISNYVTYTGKSVKQTKNYLVRLGTPIQSIIEANGGLPEDTEKVISGGPMMGKAIANLDTYITKGFSCILIINNKEGKRKASANCIRCGKCVDACPMGLEPYLLAPLAEYKRWEDMEKAHVMDCIECGCCQFSCPSSRPLLDYIRLGKNKTGAMIRARNTK
ncbi:MAG: electron transport complex subunit RsxC [Bacteroidales bacterium]|nr:electron transport complex subunit RsxC [Bacteroidales bacterium]